MLNARQNTHEEKPNKVEVRPNVLSKKQSKHNETQKLKVRYPTVYDGKLSKVCGKLLNEDGKLNN